jgi:hypothetical protein
MSDQSFLAKLDNMKDYKVLTVADLVSILAGQPPMMEVYVTNEDDTVFNPRFINSIETIDGSFYFFTDTAPRITKRDWEKSHEEKVDEKRQAAMNMQRNSEMASRMPEVVE